jgi:hypothetical protein
MLPPAEDIDQRGRRRGSQCMYECKNIVCVYVCGVCVCVSGVQSDDDMLCLPRPFLKSLFFTVKEGAERRTATKVGDDEVLCLCVCVEMEGDSTCGWKMGRIRCVCVRKQIEGREENFFSHTHKEEERRGRGACFLI